jgi:hypothetical protein
MSDCGLTIVSFPKGLSGFLFGLLAGEADIVQQVIVKFQQGPTLAPPAVHSTHGFNPLNKSLGASMNKHGVGCRDGRFGRYTSCAAARHVSPPGWSETTLGCEAADRAVVESPRFVTAIAESGRSFPPAMFHADVVVCLACALRMSLLASTEIFATQFAIIRALSVRNRM